jgi:hypothetical protein
MMDSSHERQSVGSSASVRNGLVNQELLLQNGYLPAENRIPKGNRTEDTQLPVYQPFRFCENHNGDILCLRATS